MAYERPPTFALRGWYPDDPQELAALLDELLLDDEGIGGPSPARGVIAPHAGMRYSGHVAGATYRRVQVPEVAIVLGVDHWHGGAPYSTQFEGSWRLPSGDLPIDAELARRIGDAVTILSEDTRALEMEHSLEMQLPFLHRLRPDLRIVPLQLSYLGEDEALRVGETLGRTVAAWERESGQRALLVASSDMHHQEQPFRARDDRITRDKDQVAIDRILAWDARGLYRRVRQEQISMCGFVPATVVLAAATVLGASGATLVRHATSADIPPHNFSYVVGYAGFVLR